MDTRNKKLIFPKLKYGNTAEFEQNGGKKKKKGNSLVLIMQLMEEI